MKICILTSNYHTLRHINSILKQMNDKSNYLDMQTAASLSGKSYSTIRNFVRGLSSNEREKYVLKEGKRIWIDKNFIASKYDLSEDEPNEFELKTLEILERQLSEKDRQLSELMERLKEANWNHARLQKYLIDLGFSENDIKKQLNS